MKRFFALVLALCMLMPAALAEETTDILRDVQTVMDVTASAVMLTGETVSYEQPLSAAFCASVAATLKARGLFAAEAAEGVAWSKGFIEDAYAMGYTMPADELPAVEGYYGVRAIAVDVSDDGGAVRILGDVYLAQAQLEQLTPEQYGQVEWLDRRAVVEFRRHPNGHGGWQLSFFSLDAELEMEQAAQEYFASAMVEYANPEKGFSILYPAVFDEKAVTVEENGLSGQVEGASFWVNCTANDAGWTTESFLEHQKQETPGAETNINDITGTGRLIAHGEGGTLVRLVIVTPEQIYQAQLQYDQSMSKEFSLYSDYMMHSFTVDEMGLG